MSGLKRMSKSCGGDLAVGDPVAFRRCSSVEILGRVLGFGGVPYDGVYPHVFFITPHGSVSEYGRAWIHPLEEDPGALGRLQGMEAQYEIPYPDPNSGEPLWPL